MYIALNNVRERLECGGVIQKERLYHPTDKWRKYKLLKDVNIRLSNGRTITIPKGFEWDLSSVPRIFWAILPPDGDHEIASLIHDYLYRKRLFVGDVGNYQARKFADLEMYKWSIAAKGTIKISWMNLDNRTRYRGVRWFGGFTFNKED